MAVFAVQNLEILRVLAVSRSTQSPNTASTWSIIPQAFSLENTAVLYSQILGACVKPCVVKNSKFERDERWARQHIVVAAVLDFRSAANVKVSSQYRRRCKCGPLGALLATSDAVLGHIFLLDGGSLLVALKGIKQNPTRHPNLWQRSRKGVQRNSPRNIKPGAKVPLKNLVARLPAGCPWAM